VNTYTGNMYKVYGYGAVDDIYILIVANTEKEALGFAIHDHGHTKDDWSICEVDTNQAGTDLIADIGT